MRLWSADLEVGCWRDWEGVFYLYMLSGDFNGRQARKENWRQT